MIHKRLSSQRHPVRSGWLHDKKYPFNFLYGGWDFINRTATQRGLLASTPNLTIVGSTWEPDGGIRLAGTGDYGETATGAFSVSQTNWTVICTVKPNTLASGYYISDFNSNRMALISGFQSGNYNIFGGSYPIGGSAANSQMPGTGGEDTIAWCKNGTNLRGFVNGKKYVDGTITGGNFTNSGEMRLGRPYSGTSNGFRGVIKQWLFYQTVLNDEVLKYITANPWANYRRNQQIFIPEAAAPTGFQAAWARGSNVIIGAHQ